MNYIARASRIAKQIGGITALILCGSSCSTPSGDITEPPAPSIPGTTVLVRADIQSLHNLDLVIQPLVYNGYTPIIDNALVYECIQNEERAMDHNKKTLGKIFGKERGNKLITLSDPTDRDPNAEIYMFTHNWDGPLSAEEIAKRSEVVAREKRATSLRMIIEAGHITHSNKVLGYLLTNTLGRPIIPGYTLTVAPAVEPPRYPVISISSRGRSKPYTSTLGGAGLVHAYDQTISCTHNGETLWAKEYKVKWPKSFTQDSGPQEVIDRHIKAFMNRLTKAAPLQSANESEVKFPK